MTWRVMVYRPSVAALRILPHAAGAKAAGRNSHSSEAGWLASLYQYVAAKNPQAGRSRTRPTLNRETKSARICEHSPCGQSCSTSIRVLVLNA